MKKLSIITIAFILLFQPAFTLTEDIMVFTANQNWLSRIYLLRMNATVITYFEYSFYRFTDMEVVDNELYVAEAFAPRVYKVDLSNGDLQVVIDDWSLLYFYDLAFDSGYFYLTEWDLNRYDINGNYNGSTDFQETVWGSAWDGNYYWTLTDSNIIKCWDITTWPVVTELPQNAFSPPSPHCRGLWFDGQYLWTAESIENTLGYIIQFDFNGTIVNQWLEPAFRGWGVSVIRDSISNRPSSTAAMEPILHLEQNYPNPFNPTTTIKYRISTISQVTLAVYDVLGRQVARLVSEKKPSGEYQVVWDAQDFPSGVYYYRLRIEPNFEEAKKMLLLR